MSPWSKQSGILSRRAPSTKLPNCALCNPPARAYRPLHKDPECQRGPSSRFVAARVCYRHPDCYNVTGDWEGSEQATLGDLLVHTPAELRDNNLRPAQCCQPPSSP